MYMRIYLAKYTFMYILFTVAVCLLLLILICIAIYVGQLLDHLRPFDCMV